MPRLWVKVLVHKTRLAYFDYIDTAYYVILWRPLLRNVGHRFLAYLLLFELNYLCFARLCGRRVACQRTVVFADPNSLLFGIRVRTIRSLLLRWDRLAEIKELDLLYCSRWSDGAITSDTRPRWAQRQPEVLAGRAAPSCSLLILHQLR